MTKPIIIAMDVPGEAAANALLEQLDPDACRVKIGKELFTRTGAEFVKSVIGRGFDVFLDLKYHDIPNTVARAVAAAADLGVWMVNVHATGGSAMLSAASQALQGFGRDKPILVAVTVLTSMDSQDLAEIGINAQPRDLVSKLAALSQQAGLDGVVCSAAETNMLRQERGSDFVLVTPGIRRPADAVGDQKRVVGPAEAMQAGSSYLVVGRPVTQADDPMRALAEFNSAVAGVTRNQG